jgi:hypothetical protein
MTDKKHEDYHLVVSAIVKFIEAADRPAQGPGHESLSERNDLIENSK